MPRLNSTTRRCAGSTSPNSRTPEPASNFGRWTDRSATTDTTGWFDIGSCFFFHVVNVPADGGVLDVNPAGFTHVIVDVFGYLTPERLDRIEGYWSPIY